MLRLVLPVLFAALLAEEARGADLPSVLSVQGRLLDANDRPVTTLVRMRFAIYAKEKEPVSELPAPLFAATWELTPKDGVYSVLLGDRTDVASTGTPMPASIFGDGEERWLGVSINEDRELSPRLRIGTTPRAFVSSRALVAADAERLGGELPASFHDASKLTGTLPASVLAGAVSGLTGVGTITTGTWQGTPIEDAFVESAARWDAKLAAVGHNGSLAGDGAATPLSVVFGTTAGTSLEGSARAEITSEINAALAAAKAHSDANLAAAKAYADAQLAAAKAYTDTKLAGVLPLAGGTVTGALVVNGGLRLAANANSPCGSTDAGGLRWSGSAIQFCDGSAWRDVDNSGSAAFAQFALSQSSAYPSCANTLAAISDDDPLTGAATTSNTNQWLQLTSPRQVRTSAVTVQQQNGAAPGGWGPSYTNGLEYQYFNGSSWVTLVTLSGFTEGGAPITFTHATVTASQFRLFRANGYVSAGKFVIN